MAVKNINKQMTKTPMAEIPIEERLSSFSEVALGYTDEEALNEARRCAHCKSPGCVQNCPAHNHIPDFIAEITKGDLEKAYEILRATSTMPGVCSRICAQELQCESGCLRGRNGHQSVAIGRLERYVADKAREAGYVPNEARKSCDLEGTKAAVIGAGPAGLAAAHDLADLGAAVTVYDDHDVPGGILTYGIPSFCLPNEVVNSCVDELIAKGVAFKLDVNISDVHALATDGDFDVVFLGQGARIPRELAIAGEHLKGVLSSAEFLEQAVTQPESLDVGKTCIVVGGGNTSIDVARTARRLGADVTIVYRRSLDEMPARTEEVRHAEQEGITIRFLVAPAAIIGDDSGSVVGLECVSMELGEVGEDGRRSVHSLPDSTFVLEADTIVSATGYVADPLIPDATAGLKATDRGYVESNRYIGATSQKHIFAGGDATTGPDTVVAAMVAGKHGVKGIRRSIYRARHTNA